MINTYVLVIKCPPRRCVVAKGAGPRCLSRCGRSWQPAIGARSRRARRRGERGRRAARSRTRLPQRAGRPGSSRRAPPPSAWRSRPARWPRPGPGTPVSVRPSGDRAAAQDRAGGAASRRDRHARTGARRAAPRRRPALGAHRRSAAPAARTPPAAAHRRGARRRPRPAAGRPGARHRCAPRPSSTSPPASELYGDRRAARPLTPASTIKLATAVAALSALGPDHRIATTRRPAPATHEHRPRRRRRPHAHRPRRGRRADATACAHLADDTARALQERGVTQGHARATTPRSTPGPRRTPSAPTTTSPPSPPLMADEGRLDDTDQRPGAPRRPTRPATRPATFAGLLQRARHRRSTATRAGRQGRRARRAGSPTRPLAAAVRPGRADADQQRQRHRRGPGPPDRPRRRASPPSFDGAGKAVTAQLEEAAACR